MAGWLAAPLAERTTPDALHQQRDIAEQLADLHAHLVEGKPARRSRRNGVKLSTVLHP
jgi:hypothetical protein